MSTALGLGIGLIAWAIGSVYVGCKVGRRLKRNHPPRK